ncbi:MAG: AAA family ATPase, partial [Trichodesmium sp.]
AGFSGIGKTAVVNEVHKPITRQQGYFIKGKFDQFNRNIPLSAFVQAFKDLIGQLNCESDAQLSQWQGKILETVGDNGQVLIEVIPELESIIGQQPSVAELSGSAAQNRFNQLFQKFVKVFTTVEHPLVIFLDDLQWADSASLQLIKLLMNDSHYLLMLGAYRDNEVSATHPFILTVAELKKAEAIVNTITLQPLTFKDTNHLIADTLNCSTQLAQPLTELINRKTKGNPFFTTQFLKALQVDGHITFNPERCYWECDIVQVNTLALTDDVVEFMAMQLQKFPAETQQVLKLAACIGNSFDLNTLAIVSEQSPTDVATALWKALQEGLILPKTQVYKFFQGLEQFKTEDTVNPKYRFLHDRVQQAAYSLIPDEQKQATHLKIGQLLLKNSSDSDREEKLFDIVNHLNIAQSLITQAFEREQLAELNLAAGRKAKSAIAYSAAIAYLTTGIELLEDNCWRSQYPLTLALHEATAEAMYLTAVFAQLDTIVNTTLKSAHTLLDKITIYETQIQADLAQNQLSKAIETALYVLKKLGINLPQTPNKIQVLLGLVKTKWILRGKKTKDLVNLPTMTHPDKLAAMRILACALSAAYIGAPKLLPLLIFQQVNLSVKYGNMPLSAFAYAWYGTILCGVVMDIDGGYEFGELALQTLEKFHAQNIRCKTVFLPNCFITHWKQHLTSTISGLRETYQTGVETGDLEYAAWSAMTMDAHLYWSGNQLSDLDETLHQYSEAIKEWKQNNPLLYNNIYHQSVYNLMGKTSQPKILDGPYYSEAQDIPVQIKTGDGAGLFFSYVNQLYLRYVFGDFSSAVEISNQALAYKDSGTATPLNVPLCLYHSLARLALCSDITKTERRSLLRQVTKNQKQLKKWADFAPMNSLHKWQLVEAEKCRVLGQKIKAIDLYDRAIAGAKENEYIQEEALAKELAAKFYLDWGKEKVAATYMQEAYYTYARWGAKAKNDELEQRYPSLLESIIEQQKLSRLNTSTIATLRMGTISQNTIGTPEILDLATVMKAFRTLSEEISLEGAIANLMQVVMENAGAETVVLMLFEKQVLMLKAMVTLKGVCQIEPIPVETSHVVPLSIINQVKHIQKTLVLENASNETAYARDAYIKQHQPQSVLCLPLLDRGKTIGILYLENNQVTGAFTQERVEVLNLLCSQAAISLENAQLYQQAQQALADQQQAQLQLVQTEKMATLGNLMAGVAHEINNPLGFVGGHVSIIQEYLPDLFTIIERYQEELPNPSDELTDQIEEIDLEFISEDLPKTIASMEMGIKRIREISTSLRTFSRTDTDTKSEFNLHDGLDSTLLILKYRLKANENRPEIEVIKNYGDLPNIQCYPGKLNQVFMNIIANAIDALDEASEGKNYADIEANNNQITISTKLITEKNMAVVEIADNGLGMSEEVRSRIFEQGFTTKGVGKGTGLGMAISQQIIVENHGGKISCRSELEKGTEFMIYLPLI